MKPFHRLFYGIIAAALLLKIAALFRPLTGYFSSYQAMNAMMAEMMLRLGFNGVAAPRSFIVSGDAPSLHLLYYPFGALTAAFFKGLLGGSIVFWGRFQALVYSTAALFLFKKLLCDLGEKKGVDDFKILTALFLFALAPMNLLMGIAFQNEAFALCFLLAAFCSLSKNISIGRVIAGGLFFSLAVTARIHFGLVGPSFLWLLNQRRRSVWEMLLFTAISLFLVTLWYGWVWQIEHRYPDQIQTSFFSQTGEGRILILSLFLTTAFWFPLIKIFLGVFATPLTPLGVLFAPFKGKPNASFWTCWFFSALTVIVLLPRKVIDHPFYLIAALPPACFLASEGLNVLASRFGDGVRELIRRGLGVLYVLMVLRLYLPPAFSNHNTPDLTKIGAAVQTQTQDDDRIVAQCGASPELLFYTGRLGWPFDLAMKKHDLGTQPRHKLMLEKGYGDPIRWLESLRGQKARYLVITDQALFEGSEKFETYVRARYQEVLADKDFLLFDLSKQAKPAPTGEA